MYPNEKFILQYLKMFKFFGMIPYLKSKNDLKYSGVMWIKIRACSTIKITFLFLYWIGVGYAFYHSAQLNKDMISRIVNYLQMLSDGLAMTTVFYTVLVKIGIFNAIINKFNKIDYILWILGVTKRDHRAGVQMFFIYNISFWICLFSYHIIIFGLFLYRSNVSLWYYIISNIPITIYGIFLFEAFIIIHFLRNRCILLVSRTMKYNEISVSKNFIRNKNLNLRNIFNTLHEIIELIKLINNFFGFAFFTTFATIFIVTTVQCYYIFIVISYADVFVGFDGYTIAHNLILNCMSWIFLIAMSSICEALSKSLKTLLNSMSHSIKNAEVKNK